MCCATMEQRWHVIDEMFKSTGECQSGLHIHSVGCISNDYKLDPVNIKQNLYVKKYVDEILVQP